MPLPTMNNAGIKNTPIQYIDLEGNKGNDLVAHALIEEALRNSFVGLNSQSLSAAMCLLIGCVAVLLVALA